MSYAQSGFLVKSSDFSWPISSAPVMTWVWVNINSPGNGPRILVHVSIYQGSILGLPDFRQPQPHVALQVFQLRLRRGGGALPLAPCLGQPRRAAAVAPAGASIPRCPISDFGCPGEASLGPPGVPCYPFWGEGSPTKIDYRTTGTLILTCPKKS